MSDPVLPLPSNIGGLSGLGNDARGLNDILGLLFGNQQNNNSTTTTGPSTRTTQTVIDPAGIGKIIQDMLEGDKSTNGLAALLTGQNAGGMYRSSASNLMVNDLVSRIVGEIAKVTATKVETNSGTSSSTSSSQSTPGRAGQAAAAGALGAAMKAAANKANAGGGGVKIPKPATPAGFAIDNKNRDNSDKIFTPSDDDKGPTPDPIEVQGDENLGVESVAPIDNDKLAEELAVELPPIGNLEESYTGDESLTDTSDFGDFSGDVDESMFEMPPEDSGGGDEDDGGDIIPEDEDCFLTTAVVHELGLPDNCAELTILRAFRNNWLMKNHPEDVAEYTKIAPEIVSHINAYTNKALLWRQLYREFIIPAILLIAAGKYEEAYKFYKQVTLTLKPGV